MKVDQDIENLKDKYFNKYFHFLKFGETEILECIKRSKSETIDLNIKHEIIELLNRSNFPKVGADLFFEVQDAFIHIDLKTVGASLIGKTNIGDYTSNIFVGTNQNSYNGKMIVNEGGAKEEYRDYVPTLPTFYNKGTKNEKICLSYFVTILYDKDWLDTLVMCIVCMPNGDLEPHYKTRVLQAWKNLDKTRFRFTNIPDFELLEEKEKRIKVVYFDRKMDDKYKKKLKFFEDLYTKDK